MKNRNGLHRPDVSHQASSKVQKSEVKTDGKKSWRNTGPNTHGKNSPTQNSYSDLKLVGCINSSWPNRTIYFLALVLSGPGQKLEEMNMGILRFLYTIWLQYLCIMYIV